MSSGLATTLTASAGTAVASPLRLWSIEIDPITMSEAVSRITCWIDDPDGCCKVVITPNTDHIVQLHRRPSLMPIYRADLTLADGWPLVAMSKLYGKPLPERVPGSDLLPSLCESYDRRGQPLKIFLLGGMPGVPERAAEKMETAWPSVTVVGTCSPEIGFERDDSTSVAICDQVNQSGADLLVIGLGFPKQELWQHRYRHQLDVAVSMGVGATIDFLAGQQIRAPRWVQTMKLEWLHRLAGNPRRLVKRYAVDAVYFPMICWKHWLERSTADA